MNFVTFQDVSTGIAKKKMSHIMEPSAKHVTAIHVSGGIPILRITLEIDTDTDIRTR